MFESLYLEILKENPVHFRFCKRNMNHILKTFRTKSSENFIGTDVRMPVQYFRTRICHEVSCIRICSANSLSTHVC